MPDLPNSEHSGPAETVEFARRFAESGQFREFFREGMALVEETADYLDGAGRAESKLLERPAALLYASESMRLTTRLMQLASWLLLQRAVNDGEMTQEQAEREKAKVSLETLAPNADDPAFTNLPLGLLDLITRSQGLQARVQKIDAFLFGSENERSGDNAVHDSMALLERAFPGRQ
ncbi:MAG: DUF1465 family protein [Pseudomonadota bacterium]